MSRPYLAGATGNPINLKMRIAGQALRGVPPSEGVQARAILTIGGSVSDGDTVTVGAHTYEFDTNGIVVSGNIRVDVSGGATAPAAVTALVAAMADTGHAAKGFLTFSGVVSDGELVTIGADIFEFDTNSSVTAGHIAVDVSGGATAPDAVTALVSAITASATEPISAADVTGDVVRVTYDTVGTAGNAIGSTTDCANGAWAAATLLGGVAVGAKLVSAIDGAGDTVEVTAEEQGTAGNSIGKSEVGSQTSWDAGGGGTALSGGADSAYVDLRTNGGPITREASEIQRQIISQGGAPLPNLDGKVTLGGGPLDLGDNDPANRGQLRSFANVFGKYTLTDLTTYRRIYFGLDGATSYDPFLSVLEDNDVTPRTRWTDFMLGGFEAKAGPNQNFAVSFPFAVGEYDLHGTCVQIAGAVGATLPKFKRTSAYNWTEAENAHIYLKITVVNGGGTSYTATAKVTSAETYSATVTLYPGRWIRLRDQDGEPIGEIAEQVLCYVPTGATLAVGDEFLVPQNRAAWTPSLGTERPISSVNTLFVLDGDEIRVPGGWVVNAAWEDLQGFPDTAGRQGNEVERSGELIVTVTPTRRITDLTIQHAIDQGRSLGIYIDAKTNAKIGATTKRYRTLMGFPAAKAFGTMFAVQPGGRNREEVPRFVCGVPASPGSYDDGGGALTFASHAGIYVETDVTAL